MRQSRPPAAPPTTSRQPTLRAVNRSRGTVLCARLESAGGLGGQSRGLLGRDRLEPGTGMLFENRRFMPFMWMHMLFMRFSIDVVFIGRGNTVIKINRCLKPWRFSSIVFGARRALELAAGAADESSTQLGDRIVFEPAAGFEPTTIRRSP